MSAFCRKPVSDGAGGGEPCGEPVMPGDPERGIEALGVCHDHAKVCLFSICDEPRNPWEIFCPVHRNEALEDRGDEVPTTNNDS